jgi:hypothetical protein
MKAFIITKHELYMEFILLFILKSVQFPSWESKLNSSILQNFRLALIVPSLSNPSTKAILKNEQSSSRHVWLDSRPRKT